MGSALAGGIVGGVASGIESKQQQEQFEEQALLEAVKSSAAQLTKGLALGQLGKFPTLPFTKMYRGAVQGAQAGQQMGQGGSMSGMSKSTDNPDQGYNASGYSSPARGQQQNMYQQDQYDQQGRTAYA